MEIESRVERIKNCRNLCLDFINKKKQYNKVIYVPFDSDIFYLVSPRMKNLNC